MTAVRRESRTLWLVSAALVVTGVLALTGEPGLGAAFLAATCAVAAVLRAVLRGRRPRGLAVRSALTDVLVLVVLAVAIGALSLSPGV